MTQEREEDVCCPSCKKTEKIKFYNSINLDINPELREQLFNGEINVFKCKRCNNGAILLGIPLLYHDMKRKFQVWYHPVENLEKAEFYNEFSIDGKPIIDDRIKEITPKCLLEGYLSNPHIVFSMREMVYYIFFRESLYSRCASDDIKVP